MQSSSDLIAVSVHTLLGSRQWRETSWITDPKHDIVCNARTLAVAIETVYCWQSSFQLFKHEIDMEAHLKNIFFIIIMLNVKIMR